MRLGRVKVKKCIWIDLVITTIVLEIIVAIIRKDMTITKLDITYLYMLIFLCARTLKE